MPTVLSSSVKVRVALSSESLVGVSKVTGLSEEEVNRLNLNEIIDILIKEIGLFGLTDNVLANISKIIGVPVKSLPALSLNNTISLLLGEVSRLQRAEARIEQLEYMFKRLATKYPDFQEHLSEIECL